MGAVCAGLKVLPADLHDAEFDRAYRPELLSPRLSSFRASGFFPQVQTLARRVAGGVAPTDFGPAGC
jgi:hypothetical protein